jgi:hypothetical protein
MATFAFVMPLLPGKAETDREGMQRFSTGEEKEAYEASRRALGFKRQAIWHQETPDGTIAIVLWEVDDIEAARRGIATSEEPFDRRFRDFLRDVHGIDVANEPPRQVRLVIDHRF